MSNERPSTRYEEIAAWLRDQCAQRAPGDQLPAESELVSRFSVSRMTARHAVQVLVDEGLVERRKGSGTFVAAPALHRPESVLRSFSQDMRRRGLEPASRVLRAEAGSDPRSAERLGLPPESWLVLIDRVRLFSSTAIALERTSLPGEHAGVLEADLASGSLHEALAELLSAQGRHLGRASGYVTARLASPEEAELLDLQAPAALLVESRLVRDESGRAVEATETAYAGSRWVIDTGAYVADALGAPTDGATHQTSN